MTSLKQRADKEHQEFEKEWKEHFDGEIVCSHGSPKSKGVAILQLSNSLDCRITNQWTDNDGRMIILQCTIQGKECLLINTYFPNIEKEQVIFFKSLLV